MPSELIESLLDDDRDLPYSFGGLPNDAAAWDAARFVVVPIAYDATASYVTGARLGPAAVIAASRYMELYDCVLGADTSAAGVYTLREVDPPVVPAEASALIERVVAAVADEGRIPVVLGGDHSVTIGAAGALATEGMGVLHLDAHADLRDEYGGTPLSHACVARRLDERGCRLFQVGVRSCSRGGAAYAAERGIPRLSVDEVDAFPERAADWLETVHERVYITVDMDCFDPGAVPGVGTPEPGGLDWHGVTSIVGHIAARAHVVGMDVVETRPLAGTNVTEFTAARLAYRMMGFVAAQRSWISSTIAETTGGE